MAEDGLAGAHGSHGSPTARMRELQYSITTSFFGTLSPDDMLATYETFVAGHYRFDPCFGTLGRLLRSISKSILHLSEGPRKNCGATFLRAPPLAHSTSQAAGSTSEIYRI